MRESFAVGSSTYLVWSHRRLVAPPPPSNQVLPALENLRFRTVCGRSLTSQSLRSHHGECFSNTASNAKVAKRASLANYCPPSSHTGGPAMTTTQSKNIFIRKRKHFRVFVCREIESSAHGAKKEETVRYVSCVDTQILLLGSFSFFYFCFEESATKQKQSTRRQV